MDFPFRITEEHLFCRQCRQLRLHGIYAKEAYSIRGGISPKIPLLCICDYCNTTHIAFSQEFAFANRDDDNQNYSKILGKNRLAIGNWIYIKGEPRPGTIKSWITDQQQNKQISIDYGNGVTKKYQLKNQDIPFTETAIKGYRLLPYQSGETLIGDHIYHIHRDKFGKAVGIVHDGDTDKLVIHFEDNVILFLTLPEPYQSLPNRRLEETAKYKLKDIPENISSNIQIKAKNGVLYLSGKLESLLERRTVLDKLNSITAMRGIYSKLLIYPNEYINDKTLEDKIHRIFEDSNHPELVYYTIEVQKGKAQIYIGYYSEKAIHYFENKIENLPGIIELSLFPECVSMPNEVEHKRIQDIESVIKKYEDEQTKIFIRRTNDKIIISGRAPSIFQKKKIQFNVINLNSIHLLPIVNNLRITTA